MKVNFCKRVFGGILAVCMAASVLPAHALAGVFDGVLDGGALGGGESKKSVKVTLRYQYSPTGGMAGVNAHAAETVEFFLNEDGASTTPAAWPIPYYEEGEAGRHPDHDHDNLQGFRVVLNVEPLNAFLVRPPEGDETPEELQAALDRGEFDLDPAKIPDDAALDNVWIAARTFTDPDTGLEFQVVDKDGDGAVGSAPLDGPQLRLKNPEALTGDQEVELTVNYRRDNGRYTVRHLVPKNDLYQDVNDPDQWQVDSSETKEGRIGAATNAQAKFIYGRVNLAIAQQPIEVDGKTVIDIFYVKDDTFRVVFDTSDCSGAVDMQTLKLGGKVDFSPEKVTPPTKEGYIFNGWKYRGKNADGTPGDWCPVIHAAQYDEEGETLTLDEELLSQAYFQPSQEAQGVNVLRLYPIWEPGTTRVRVVFWTEDLTGEDDVDSRVKDSGGDLTVVTHHYDEEGALYSNAGSRWLEDVRTDSALAVTEAGELTYTGADGTPKAWDLQEKLAGLESMQFDEPEEERPVADASVFFTLDGHTIAQREDGDGQGSDCAASEGTTVVNLYYIRNIYRLEFIYGEKLEVEEDGVTQEKLHLGANTLGYAMGYTGQGTRAGPNFNALYAVAEGHEGEVPDAWVVTAKYGADLRGTDRQTVWPFHPNLRVLTTSTVPDKDPSKDTRFSFASWTTTAGFYNKQAMGPGGSGEPTLMGVYGAMSAEIIRDPARHIALDDYSEKEDTHRMYAYWSDWATNSHYQYNHCYEIPGLTQDMLEAQVTRGGGAVKLGLDGQDETNPSNVSYLIPVDNGGEALALMERYGFDDLRQVGYDPAVGAASIAVDDDGGYYAFRVYKNKCYALARQVSVLSSNSINAQTPSARSHMTRVNEGGVADHSTKHADGEGARPYGVVGRDTPYPLFFYYDRDSYTVRYSVEGSDLGSKTLYYGEKLRADEFDIRLESGVSPDGQTPAVKTNGEYAAPADPSGWTLPAGSDGSAPVCPGRNEKGTTAWTFRGWALDLAGSAMLDDPGDWDGVVSGNLALYAQWEAPKYTVTFDWDGGHLEQGPDRDYKEQAITANSTVALAGLVPTPVRPGYALASWEVTELEVGGAWRAAAEEEKRFSIDTPVTANIRVKAVWKEIDGADVYTYAVHHVLESDPTVEVAAAQTVTGSFVPGAKVWGNPVKPEGAYAAYIPVAQNGSSQVPLKGKDIVPIQIRYRPPTAADAYSYRVEFVDHADQTAVLSVPLAGAERSRTVYAGAYADALDEKGYWLSDEAGERLDGVSDALLATLPKEGNTTARFPVVKEVFPIAYDVPAGMSQAQWEAMEAALPKEYTPADGAAELPVPGENGTYEQEGKTYGFTGWKLTRGTLRGEPGSAGQVFDAVTVHPESRGALTFQAQWAEESRGVDFFPGEHGTLPEEADAVSFLSLAAKPLGEQKEDKGFAVPEVTAQAGYTFTGWKMTGDASGKLYSAAAIEALTPAVGRTAFTAQYRRTNTGNGPGPSVPVQPPADDGDVSTWLERERHDAYIFGRDGGLVAPEANITRAEVAMIFFRLLTDERRESLRTTENAFSDVGEDAWYSEAAATLAKAGILKGYPDGAFRPNAFITRAEFATVAARFLSDRKAEPSSFSDVAGHWAEEYIHLAAAVGWVKGYPDGTFRPDALITRAEAITLVNAVLGRAPRADGLREDMIRWPDNADPAAWYYLAVQEATNSHAYRWETASGARTETWTKVEQ